MNSLVKSLVRQKGIIVAIGCVISMIAVAFVLPNQFASAASERIQPNLYCDSISYDIIVSNQIQRDLIGRSTSSSCDDNITVSFNKLPRATKVQVCYQEQNFCGTSKGYGTWETFSRAYQTRVIAYNVPNGTNYYLRFISAQPETEDYTATIYVQS